MKSSFSLLGLVGQLVIGICRELGQFTTFALNALSHIVRPPYFGREYVNAFMTIGYFSLPVIGLTTLFAGAALALQIYAGGARFSVETTVPAVVAIGIVRELGPVLCGLMVAGRATSAIAAEIATMKVTEQVDALITLSIHPTKYLVTPRVVAATLVLPILTGIGDILGILGGCIVSATRLEINPDNYINTTLQFLDQGDIVSGLVKAAVFGIIIALIGCYTGLHSGRGAIGVGTATTRAVAASSALIIASNYILTELFFSA